MIAFIRSISPSLGDKLLLLSREIILEKISITEYLDNNEPKKFKINRSFTAVKFDDLSVYSTIQPI